MKNNVDEIEIFYFFLDEKILNYMIKSEIIDLSLYPEFMNFLEQESINLDDENLQLIESDLKEKISKSLDKFGSVFVKINFSSASDASFLVNKLQCFSLLDILMLIKGSNKISENISMYEKVNEKNSKKLYLLLKQWYKIDHRNEFRLFIHNCELKAISQRYLNYFFNYTKDELKTITDRIKTFIYSHHIKEFLEKNYLNKNVFVDILLLKDSNKLKIIDILDEEYRQMLVNCSNIENDNDNYFLLFSDWDHIQSIQEDIDFKIISSENEIMDISDNLNKFPLEIIENENHVNVAKIVQILQEH